MKKILSLLATISMVSTSSIGVASCSLFGDKDDKTTTPQIREININDYFKPDDLEKISKLDLKEFFTPMDALGESFDLHYHEELINMLQEMLTKNGANFNVEKWKAFEVKMNDKEDQNRLEGIVSIRPYLAEFNTDEQVKFIGGIDLKIFVQKVDFSSIGQINDLTTNITLPENTSEGEKMKIFNEHKDYFYDKINKLINKVWLLNPISEIDYELTKDIYFANKEEDHLFKLEFWLIATDNPHSIFQSHTKKEFGFDLEYSE